MIKITKTNESYYLQITLPNSVFVIELKIKKMSKNQKIYCLFYYTLLPIILFNVLAIFIGNFSAIICTILLFLIAIFS